LAAGVGGVEVGGFSAFLARLECRAGEGRAVGWVDADRVHALAVAAEPVIRAVGAVAALAVKDIPVERAGHAVLAVAAEAAALIAVAALTLAAAALLGQRVNAICINPADRSPL